MPGKYVYAAFWGGQEGTFLLWALLTTTLGLVLMRWRSPLKQPAMFFLNLPVIMLTGRFRKNIRSEEHTSELQSLRHLVCRLLLEKKNYEAPLEPNTPQMIIPDSSQHST